MKVVLVLLGAVWLSACEPHQPTASQARQDVGRIEFVRHANGLCFGVVRFSTYAGFQGSSITLVPSEACQQAEAK